MPPAEMIGALQHGQERGLVTLVAVALLLTRLLTRNWLARLSR